jgi:hypothetical protein
MMFVVYQTIPEKEIRQTAKESIEGVTKWFAEHPKRRICRVEVWYGRQIKVKRTTVAQQINEAAEAAIKGK